MYKSVNWIGGGVPARILAFDVGARPALYRFDISIRRSTTGAFLGKYSEYFRVVPKRVKVDLALNSPVYAPTGKVAFRLRNTGTADIFYGYEFAIEYHSGGGWVVDSVTPSGWPLIGLILRGGEVGECQSVTLGGRLGAYRVTKKYSSSPTGIEREVRAYFRAET